MTTVASKAGLSSSSELDFPWFRACLLRGWIEQFGQAFPDHHLLMHAAGLPSALSNAPDAAWPVEPLMKLLRMARLGGYPMDERGTVLRCLRIEDAGEPYLRRLRHYGSLDRAIQNLVRDSHLISNLFQFQASADVNGFQVNVAMCIDSLRPGYRLFDWTSLTLVIRLVQHFLGESWKPTELRLRSAGVDGQLQEGPMKGVRVRYGQPESSIHLPMASGRLSASVQRSKMHLIVPTTNTGRWVEGLKRVLKAYLIDGYPPIGLLAELGGRSERSIQRDLAKAGYTYSELIQEIRSEWAVELLQDPELRILDIALELGYEDASHFARAFRRSMGVSPSQFKKRRTELPPLEARTAAASQIEHHHPLSGVRRE